MCERKVLLWVDDMRDPESHIPHSMYRYYEFYSCCGMDFPLVIWVKDYKEFVNYISENGIPYEICFDHDLGEGHSGFDCVKWLVGYCMEHGNIPLPICNSQSSNPVGRENILSYAKSYNKSLD